MAEVFTELILPGTYIEVRAEGLLTIGGISTGNVALIGTAEKGGNEIYTLSSFDEGKAMFGNSEPWDPIAEESNLTLVRALKLLFNNGARTVYAKRVFDENNAKPATYQLMNESNSVAIELKSKTPGSWGNKLQIRVEEGETRELITNEIIIRNNGTLALSAHEVISPETPETSIGTIIVRESGLLKRYQLKQSAATGDAVQLDPSNRNLTFANMPTQSADVSASYFVPGESLRKITLRYENFQEEYIVPSVSYLNQLLTDENNPSNLVEVVQTNGNALPKINNRFEAFTDGENGSVTSTHFQEALEEFVDKNIQLVVVAGQKFSDIKAPILGHVEKTENLGRERIAVIGVDSNDIEKIIENSNEVADKRVVLVAPGIRQKEPQTGRIQNLPSYFTAAAIAGKLSGTSPHISLTNKTIAGIDGLAADYNYGQLKSCIENRVCTVQKKRGLRVVKAISTDDAAFRQISIRRIIDYIKEGTRIGSNQYIGRLNNARVRSALHTTLNSFLTDMVTREFLTNYALEVFADRPMEIRGEVLVTMNLQPTFSIDIIKVIMNLS